MKTQRGYIDDGLTGILIAAVALVALGMVYVGYRERTRQSGAPPALETAIAASDRAQAQADLRLPAAAEDWRAPAAAIHVEDCTAANAAERDRLEQLGVHCGLPARSGKTLYLACGDLISPQERRQLEARGVACLEDEPQP